jgi:CRP-like cAMP-binding protein
MHEAFSRGASIMQTASGELGRTSNATPMQFPATGKAGWASTGLRRTFAKGEALYREGDPVDCRYRVISGTVLTSTLLRDGRCQIDAFHIPGAVLGLESSNVRSFTAEAIEPVAVEVFRRLAFADLLDGDRSS